MATLDDDPSAERIHGENPDPSVTLRSSDLQDFSIPKSAAVLSPTIRKMLKDNSPDGTIIPLHKVGGRTLATVAAYLDALAAAGKRFDGKLFSDEVEVLLDVVLAAHNLDIPDLMDMVSEKIADRMKNRSVEWVRKAFGIENDLTDAEVAEVKSQYSWAWEGVEPDNDG